MRIAIGSDEKSILTDFVLEELSRRGIKTEIHGALNPKSGETLWPQVGFKVGTLVASGKCQEGILFCWTGTGVTIAANKVPGIRAALCADGPTAIGARRWNHANVLVMSLRSTSLELAREILEGWFSTPNGLGKDADCVAQISEIEQKFLHKE